MIWFACKQCGRRDSRPDEQAGTLVFCTCGQGNRVPWESDAAAAEAPVPAMPSEPRRTSWEDPEPRRSASARPRLSEWGEPKKRDPAFCFNHQEKAAERACAACGESFCAACLIDLQGKTLCGPCKNFQVRGMLRPGRESGLAIIALIVGLVSTPVTFLLTILPLGMQESNTPAMAVCSGLGLVLPFVATGLAMKSLADMHREPRLRGRSLAVMGLVTGLAGLLWCASTLGVTLFRLATD